jgi:hypothetical protein
MSTIEYLSSGEAADVLHIKVEAFRQRYKRGRLPFEPAAHAGGLFLWRRTDIARYAAAEAIK